MAKTASKRAPKKSAKSEGAKNSKTSKSSTESSGITATESTPSVTGNESASEINTSATAAPEKSKRQKKTAAPDDDGKYKSPFTEEEKEQIWAEIAERNKRAKTESERNNNARAVFTAWKRKKGVIKAVPKRKKPVTCPHCHKSF